MNNIIALSMNKYYRTGYKFLRKLFALPSHQTVTTLLDALPTTACMNNESFKYLKECSVKMKKKDKYCALLFDVTSFSASILYD
jgi:hypothetical protein